MLRSPVDPCATSPPPGGAGQGAADALPAAVVARAGELLLEDLGRQLPRLATALREIVRDWSEADVYASRGATVADLMADSAVLRGVVTRRLACLPRLALSNAVAELDDDPAARGALLEALSGAGVPVPPDVRPEEVGGMLAALGVLQEPWRGAVDAATRAMTVFPPPRRTVSGP